MSSSNTPSTLSAAHAAKTSAPSQNRVDIAGAALVVPLTQDTYATVWRNVFDNLCLRDLCSVACTCRSFQQIVTSLPIWSQVLERLGKQRIDHITAMRQVMRLQHRCGICEVCGRLGQRYGAKNILRIRLTTGNLTVGMCLECRKEFIATNLLLEQDDDFGLPESLTPAQVARELFIRGEHLEFMARSYNGWVPRDLILFEAQSVYGGNAGIMAMRAQAERDRQSQLQSRVRRPENDDRAT
ncbi:hypothetical protein BC940DRAFT_308211 [Gongronella butleri]|nr:hypothetical protein BC940DRAFT_308211 [Gongronella butleri]